MPSPPKPAKRLAESPHPLPSGEVGIGPSDRASTTSLAYARSVLAACDLDPVEGLDAGRTRGPDRSPASEWAMSGAMSLTGHADETPRWIQGPIASAMRGVVHVLESLAPSLRRLALDGPALLGERAAIFGLTRHGTRSAGGSARLLSTRTGFIALNLPREEDWRLMPAWLEATLDSITEPTTEPTRNLISLAPKAAGARAEAESRWQELAAILSARDARALVERGRLMGLAVAPVPRRTPADAPLFRLHHASQSEPRPRAFARPEKRPARRLRLLDLSTLWAGPLATALLAEAGIEVLKVESPGRPDGARSGPKPFFDLMHSAKQGCALDLRDRRDRAHFERLLAAADIVVESARPRALAQLGFDAEGWVSERRGRLWVSLTGYGRDHEWIAFGDDAAAAAGLAWSPDPRDDGPCFCADALADPVAGLHAAALILAQLRAGRGGLLDLSLRDVTAHASSASDAAGAEPRDRTDQIGDLHDVHATDRAGSTDSRELVLPIERRGSGWVAIDRGRVVPIAPPRARKARGSAPLLAAPTEEILRNWASEPC